MPNRLISLWLLFFLGCQSGSDEDFISIQGVAMHIPFEIKTCTKNQEQVKEIIQKTFDDIDQIYNNWNLHSKLSKLNSPVLAQPLPKELYPLLLLTDLAVHLTKGHFDPTIYPVLKLWKHSLAEGLVVSDEELLSQKELVGWKKITFTEEIFSKKSEKMQVDLCGIAKGFAVDLLFDRLIALGLKSVYVEWGGEIKVSHHHPSGRPWQIGIKGDNETSPLLLSRAALATSGNYAQTWTASKKTFTHIVDPTTLKPLEVHEGSLASVTVVAPSCALADALATSAFLFPEKEVLPWVQDLEKHYPVKFYFLYKKPYASLP